MSSCTSVPLRLLELIDTLWNVNFDPVSFAGLWFAELIDTLWNVNRIDLYCLVRLRLTN